MQLYEWAKRHNVSSQAIQELQQIFGMYPTDSSGMSEAAIQQRVRLEASKRGEVLWRNNVGVLTNEAGIPVRYGLCNESKAMNEKVKSSDLIGIRPVLIQPSHVGLIIGQFIARETKKGGWVYKGTDREIAQLKFMQIVNSMGGDAQFTTGEG